MFNIKVLNALDGDCIIISYGEKVKHHILVDGGKGRLCFQQLGKCLDNIKKAGNKLDLLILTHTDNDHIDGIVRLFSQKTFDPSMIDEIWFNFGKGLKDTLGIGSESQKISLYDSAAEISWKQGVDLEEKIQKAEIKRRFVTKLDKILIAGAEITILSPSKDVLKKIAKLDQDEGKNTTEIAYSNDYTKSILELNQKELERKITLSNKSSIACLFEFNGQRVLLLGDADADTIVNSLTELGYSKNSKLKVDYCKISHHASKYNTSNELIEMLDCSNYIISTHLTAQGRPSKECLSRIICNSKKAVSFYCNYELDWSYIAELIFNMLVLVGAVKMADRVVREMMGL